MANKYTANQIRGVISDYRKGEHNVKTLAKKHKMNGHSVKYYLEKADKVALRKKQAAKRKVKAMEISQPKVVKKLANAPVKVTKKAAKTPVKVVKEAKKPHILSTEQRQALFADHKRGLKIDQLAAKYDVSTPTVYNVIAKLKSEQPVKEKVEEAKPVVKKVDKAVEVKKVAPKKAVVKKAVVKKVAPKKNVVTSEKILSDLSNQINALVKNAFEKLSLNFASSK